jgi:8-oxo-dGTP diphosphatase
MPRYSFPVLAVRAFVKDRKGRILLLKRGSSAYGNEQWCLPGGKVDYNSSPEQSIIREIREETGLVFHGARFLFYQNSLPLKKGRMHCVNFYFEGRARGTITLNEESSSYVWVSPCDSLDFRPVFGAREALLRYKKECRRRGKRK